MKAFLIIIAAMNTLAALVTVNTKPGSPREPHGSARMLMIALLIEVSMAGWALWLFWSLP